MQPPGGRPRTKTSLEPNQPRCSIFSFFLDRAAHLYGLVELSSAGRSTKNRTLNPPDELGNVVQGHPVTQPTLVRTRAGIHAVPPLLLCKQLVAQPPIVALPKTTMILRNVHPFTAAAAVAAQNKAAAETRVTIEANKQFALKECHSLIPLGVQEPQNGGIDRYPRTTANHAPPIVATHSSSSQGHELRCTRM